MKRSCQRIIIWFLVFSLLLPNFSVSVYANEVSDEIETEKIIQEKKTECILIEDSLSGNDVTEETIIEEENLEDNSCENTEFEEDVENFSENNEQAEHFKEFSEENNGEQLNDDLENLFENEYVESKEKQGNIITNTTNVKSSLRTVDEALAWVKSLEGKAYDYDGVYGAQCVDLIAGYYNYLGVPVASGNGCDYATNTLPTAYGWQRIKDGVPQKGDILVYNGNSSNPAGHVAIYEDEKILWHGRYAGSGKVQKTTTIKYNGFSNSYWGLIRPKFTEPYHNPHGVVETISGGEASITIGGWVIDNDEPDSAVLIHVYIGGPSGSGAPCYVFSANIYGSDVGYHRFSEVIPTDKTGNVDVYIYAINIAGGTNNPQIGCGTATVVADTTKPIIRNAYIKDYDKDGFTVVAEVEDNVGIQRVRFPTRRSGSDHWNWYEGIKVNEGIYEYRVNVSEFDNYEGDYYTHIYTYDNVGNIAEVKHLSQYIDRTSPSISSVEFNRISSDTVRISSVVSDDLGMDHVAYAIWTHHEGQDDLKWVDTQFNGSEYIYDMNISEHNNEKGQYAVHVYAWDEFDNLGVFGSGFNFDELYYDDIPPIISNVEFERIYSDTVQVSCQVTDESEITKVSFPTWTRYNNQDDMKEPWVDHYDGIKNGSTYTYTFKDYEHNFEKGTYVVHIYAWDEFGNVTQLKTENYEFNNLYNVISYYSDGHRYELYDDVLTWQEAKEKCEELGGHLVTITSQEEQDALINLMNVGRRTCYFIGSSLQNGEFSWITGEDFDYTNWNTGEPNNYEGKENIGNMYKNGTWNDTNDQELGWGFICEYEPEPTSVKAFRFETDSIQLNIRDSVQLPIIIEPSDIQPHHIKWASSNKAVAQVEQGMVTAVSPGNAVISASYAGKTITCNVEVVQRVEKLEPVGNTNIGITVGNHKKLDVRYLPENATTGKEVFWSSSDSTIVTVEQDGTINALTSGNAIITASLKGNEAIQTSWNVNVNSFYISFDTNGGNQLERLECRTMQIPKLPIPVKENYVFEGWYQDKECSIPFEFTEIAEPKDFTLYAKWMESKDGLWIDGLEESYIYTGKAIKPQVNIYDGTTLLKEKVDYTISYKNNVNVNDGTNKKTAPTITVTGKGNYNSKETLTFAITPKNIESADITAPDILKKYNEKVQKAAPTVKDGKTTLKNKTHYTLEYPNLTEETSDAYKEPGTYEILIHGKGNYTGTRRITLTISPQNLISSASVSSIDNQKYTGDEIEPTVKVTHNKKRLTEGTDYTVFYEDNVKVGTATAVITGAGNYTGEKRVTFKITGSSISNAKITGVPKSVPYTGNDVKAGTLGWETVPTLTVTVNKQKVTLVEGKDYLVSYLKNTNKGTASIVFTGINQYTGTLKKNFTISSYHIGTDEQKQITAYLTGDIAYDKAGSKPKPVVIYGNETLTEGKDYTLKYKNNTSVNNGSNPKKLPTVTITGKGNYTGSQSLNFTILPKEISGLTITVPDKVQQNKKNTYKSTPKVTDISGKALSAGTDYEKSIRYTYKSDTILKDGTLRKAGDDVTSKDIPPTDTIIIVTVTGKGNYTGTLDGEYRLIKRSIGSAKVTIPAQIYTGNPITPRMNDIKVTYGKETLGKDDYEIIGYSNNVKKGNAYLTIRGIGNYGGTKKIKFTIKAKGFLWWKN